MTGIPAQDTLGGTGDPTQSEFKTAIEQLRDAVEEMIGGSTESDVTLASDKFALANLYRVYVVDTEGAAASDDWSSVTSGAGVRDGDVIYARIANNARVVTVINGIGGADQILTRNGRDIVLADTRHFVALKYNSTALAWEELFNTADLQITEEFLGALPDTELTISGGAVVPTRAIHTIDTEGDAATDNLDLLTPTYLEEGRVLIIHSANAARVVTVRHNQAGDGGVILRDGASVVLQHPYQMLWLRRVGADWEEIGRFGFTTPGNLDQGVAGGRLTLSSTDPVDATGSTASTLYYLPYKHAQLSLYDTTGLDWITAQFTNPSIALPASQFRIYDVFAYNSGTRLVPVVSLELNAWDSGGQVSGAITDASAANPCVLTAANTLSVGDVIAITGVVGTIGTDVEQGLNGKMCRVYARDAATITLEDMYTTGLAYTSDGTWFKIPTARTDAISRVNGVYVKSADNTRRYLGSVMTWESAGESHTISYRCLVWNMCNRLPRQLRTINSAGGYTCTNTGGYEMSNHNSTDGYARLSVLIGLAEDAPLMGSHYVVAQSVAGSKMYRGIRRNGCSSVSDLLQNTVECLVITRNHYASQVSAIAPLTAGYSFLQTVDSVSAATATIGNLNINVPQGHITLHLPM